MKYHERDEKVPREFKLKKKKNQNIFASLSWRLFQVWASLDTSELAQNLVIHFLHYLPSKRNL